MKRLLVITTVAIALMACNKNQKAVKTLDGKWEATAILVSQDGFNANLVSFGLADLTLDFENCKLKDEAYCDINFAFTVQGETEVEDLLYRVADEGTKLIVLDTVNTDQIFTIIDLRETYLEMTGDLSGLPVRLQLEKVE